MSTTANRTRGAVPTRMAAAIAALSLLAMPVPAGAQGSGRTVLLTLAEGASLTQLADTVGALGGRVLATLELSDSLLVELPQGVGAPAGSAEIPDTPMRVNGTQQYYETTEPTYRDTIGAPTDATAGEHVTVALIDTGVSAEADGLGRNVVHLNLSDGAAGDGLGHGTFLAGIIAGTGKFKGVAPGADILDVQVADETGATSLWTVLKGLDAAYERGADVVNLSLSTDSPLPPSFDPLSRTLETLWDEGVTVVVAAGNDGPGWGTVGSPGNNPTVITVGALDEKATAETDDDSVAEFSSRGSVYDAMKPDLVAPGVSLVSTAAPGSIAVKRNKGSLVGDGYMRGSGTSMSAAVVSGAVAALLSKNDPRLSPDAVKAHLQATAHKSKRLQETDGAGAGALDLGAALGSPVDEDATQGDPEIVSDPFGPDEADAKKWATFASIWAAGKDEDGPEGGVAGPQPADAHLGSARLVDGRRRQQPRWESRGVRGTGVVSSGLVRGGVAGARMVRPRMVGPRLERRRVAGPRMVRPRLERRGVAGPRMVGPRLERHRLGRPRMVGPGVERQGMVSTRMVRPGVERQGMVSTRMVRPRVERQGMVGTRMVGLHLAGTRMVGPGVVRRRLVAGSAVGSPRVRTRYRWAGGPSGPPASYRRAGRRAGPDPWGLVGRRARRVAGERLDDHSGRVADRLPEHRPLVRALDRCRSLRRDGCGWGTGVRQDLAGQDLGGPDLPRSRPRGRGAHAAPTAHRRDSPHRTGAGEHHPAAPAGQRPCSTSGRTRHPRLS